MSKVHLPFLDLRHCCLPFTFFFFIARADSLSTGISVIWIRMERGLHCVSSVACPCLIRGKSRFNYKRSISQIRIERREQSIVVLSRLVTLSTIVVVVMITKVHIDPKVLI